MTNALRMHLSCYLDQVWYGINIKYVIMYNTETRVPYRRIKFTSGNADQTSNYSLSVRVWALFQLFHMPQ